MSASVDAADRELRSFLDARSPIGLLQHYARTRAGNLKRRLGMVLLSIVAVVDVFPPEQALAIALALTLTQLGESLLLTRLARWPGLTNRLPLAQGLTALWALVESGTVALGIGTLLFHAGEAANIVAIALTLGGVFDAAVQLRRNRWAANVRMAVYALVLGAIFRPDLWSGHQAPGFFDQIATALLLYIVISFTQQVLSGRKRADLRQEQILRAACEMGRLNDLLTERRERARELSAIAEHVQDSIVVTDGNGMIVWVNPAFSRTMGYAREEVIGRHVTMLNGPETDGAVIQSLLDARKERRVARVEIIGRRKDGGLLWLDTSLAPVLNEDGSLRSVIGVERDITEAKDREWALAEAREAAEAAVRARHAFLATMSHEIRTPMNGVLGTAELLLDTVLNPVQRTMVETISRSGDALLHIVDDILDFSRLEAGRMTVAQKPFDLAATLREALDLVRPLTEGKGLSLTADLPEPPLPHLLGDSGRLRQVVLNLLGNAIKFTQSGEVRLVLAAEPSAEGMRLDIAVHDTGVGIAPENLDRIFDSFAQADDSVAGRFGGTGLGLSISRRLAEAMGGALTAESEPDKGSVFVLRLTLPEAGPGLIPQEESRDTDTAFPLEGRKILVADDNRTNMLLLEKMLAPLGPHLILAVNGQEAVEYFVRHSPDLVLMDVRMPVLDGLEATQRIRTVETLAGVRPCPVVALTANAFAEDRQRCEAAGMSDFLSKPFRKKDLLEVIRRNLPPLEDTAPPPVQATAVSKAVALE